MKNKWISWTLTVLLTLVVLVGVGVAGFRLGFITAQNKDGAPPFFVHSQRIDNNEFNKRLGNNDQDFDHKHRLEFDRSFHHGFRRGGLFSLFGLIRLAVLGLIIWGGYTLYKRSGWQFVKVNASEAESTEPVEEAKPERKKKK